MELPTIEWLDGNADGSLPPGWLLTFQDGSTDFVSLAPEYEPEPTN